MIDWDRVLELRDEVGEDAFDEVVELFIEEVDEVAARLRTTPDPALYEEDLHFLKGSAVNLGFEALGRMCQDGESRAAAGGADSIDMIAILDCYARSREAFMARLARGLAA